MAKGRKKTAQQHKKTGTFRGDRHAAPVVRPGRPAQPKGLSKRAAAWWKRIVDQLDAHNMISTIDSVAMQLLVETLSDYEQAREEVERDGITVETPNGCPVQNPAVGVMSKAREMAAKLLRKFGLTPLDRTGLDPMDGQGELSEFERMLFRAGGNLN